MRIIRDIYYGSEKIFEKTLDIYLPDEEPTALFLYMHGGGLEAGHKYDRWDALSAYLTARGIGHVSINYRMYPTAHYPDFIVDAAEAVAWTYRYMKTELSCDKLYVGGSSAGGYLSMMLCFDEHYLTDVGMDPSAIAGYFHDAGQPTAHYNVLRERGIDERRVIVDESAPIFHIAAGHNYPPMRFIISDNDAECRYEQTMLVLATLRHFGYSKFDHRVMNGRHCAYVARDEENGDPTLGTMIYSFIEDARNGKI